MRIISGKYGGRILKQLQGDNTRPTSDKMKETLFNIIGPYFKGGNVLDLYAGSGALGIEAVSRGMDFAVLVDKHQDATNIISQNIKMTQELSKFEIFNLRSDVAMDTLQNRKEKFSLIFLDPPYIEQKILNDINHLIEKKLLDNIAVIVCEVAIDVELPENIQGISKWDERKFGNKKLIIYQKITN